MQKPFYYIKTLNTLSISTTGNFCALNCKHCNKHYLNHMKTFENIFKNSDFQTNENLNGYTSYLVSGGSNKDGYVPFFNHIKNIEKLKSLHKKINLHTGLLSTKYFQYLSIADSVSIDIIGDDHTINFVYNLDKKAKDYFKYFEKLVNYKIKNNLSFKIVPHITIGLNGGKASGEKNALNFLKQFSTYKSKILDTIVFLILIPTKGTYFEKLTPPDYAFVKDIFQYGYENFNNSETNLFLGCMRPKGKYRKEIDKIATKSGINGIVNPTFDKDYISNNFIKNNDNKNDNKNDSNSIYTTQKIRFSKIVSIYECCALV